MDPIDILGELLGRKSQKTGRDGSVLDDMFGGKSSGGDRASGGSGPSRSAPADLQSQAKELEDLLGVAKQRAGTPASPVAVGGGPATGSRGPSRSEYPWTEAAQTRPAPASVPGNAAPANRSVLPEPGRSPSPAPSLPGGPSGMRPGPPRDQNEEALVLIRAMVNAAKADGEISRSEQQALLEQIGDGSPAAIEFLRQEIARPLDVRAFAWSIPLGMEQKVYAVSLATVQLDSPAEAEYLLDLAHGLRISPAVRRQLHDYYRVPQLDR